MLWVNGRSQLLAQLLRAMPSDVHGGFGPHSLLENEMSYYTGVGSRETPPDIMRAMYHFAKNMANRGQILRTGGAQGADNAFAEGALKSVNQLVEIYLPWQGFNGW